MRASSAGIRRRRVPPAPVQAIAVLPAGGGHRASDRPRREQLFPLRPGPFCFSFCFSGVRKKNARPPFAAGRSGCSAQLGVRVCALCVCLVVALWVCGFCATTQRCRLAAWLCAWHCLRVCVFCVAAIASLGYVCTCGVAFYTEAAALLLNHLDSSGVYFGAHCCNEVSYDRKAPEVEVVICFFFL